MVSLVIQDVQLTLDDNLETMMIDRQKRLFGQLIEPEPGPLPMKVVTFQNHIYDFGNDH